MPRPFRSTVTRWFLDGRRCKPGTPGATCKQIKTRTYYAKIDGKKVSLKTKDEGQAWEKLRAMLRRRAEGKAGLRDEYTDAAELPLLEHVEAWCAYVTAKGATEKCVTGLRRTLERVSEEAGWKSLADLSAETALTALDRLCVKHDLHAQTRNNLLSHLKQFSRWCSKHGRLRSHVLDSLAPRPVEDDRCHERRCPADDEVGRLWKYLYGPGARRRKGMDGKTRALGYKVAMACGLRAGELGALTRESFDLDRGEVTVPAAYDKRRRRVVCPLPPWLVEELAEWLPKAPGGPLWPFGERNPGVVLYADLRACGVPPSVPGPDGKPLFFDMHAMRVWYITRMSEMPGMDVKTLMDLARHSDPRLTLRVYARGSRERREQAARALPPPGSGGGDRK